jgi:hypothetical protein
LVVSSPWLEDSNLNTIREFVEAPSRHRRRAASVRLPCRYSRCRRTGPRRGDQRDKRRGRLDRAPGRRPFWTEDGAGLHLALAPHSRACTRRLIHEFWRTWRNPDHLFAHPRMASSSALTVELT